jgi:thymidylate synthase (FAD)
MVEFKFLVRVPMDCWRQWIRHRTASVNEYSTRYSEAIDSAQRTTEWRAQSTGNKQGSSGLVEEWPEGYKLTPAPVDGHWDRIEFERNGCKYSKILPSPSPTDYLSYQEKKLLEKSREVYEERLAFGVAREQARKDLPLSTYTEAYWKIDLHNLFHFLRLRIDSHAQAEIREYGAAILKLIQPIVPLCVEAFMDYRVKSLSLSGPELKVLEILHMRYAVSTWPLSKRENAEFRAKLPRLSLHHLVEDFDKMLANMGIQ